MSTSLSLGKDLLLNERHKFDVFSKVYLRNRDDEVLDDSGDIRDDLPWIKKALDEFSHYRKLSCGEFICLLIRSIRNPEDSENLKKSHWIHIIFKDATFEALHKHFDEIMKFMDDVCSKNGLFVTSSSNTLSKAYFTIEASLKINDRNTHCHLVHTVVGNEHFSGIHMTILKQFIKEFLKSLNFQSYFVIQEKISETNSVLTFDIVKNLFMEVKIVKHS